MQKHILITSIFTAAALFTVAGCSSNQAVKTTDGKTIVTDGKKFMKVAVPDGFVSILSLQLPGKKRLKIDELLRGYHLEDGCLMK